MKNTARIAKRELLALFRGYSGYVFIALFIFLLGVYVTSIIQVEHTDFLYPIFFEFIIVSMFILPFVSARAVAGEVERQSLDLLIWRPVGEAGIILGKYFGLLAFFVVVLIISAVFPSVLAILTQLDTGALITGYTGVFLFGALFLAVGVFFSTLFRKSTVAGLVALVFLLFFVFINTMLPAYSPISPADALAVKIAKGFTLFIREVSFLSHVRPFLMGSIVLSDVVYVVGFVFVALYLAIIILKVRK